MVTNFIIHYNCKCHRIPGIVVDKTTHGDKVFHKVAVVGGLLNTSYLRTDLIHEQGMSPSAVNLDGLLENWQTLKKISVREGLKNISLTGGQGHIKCSCTTGCSNARCACFKAGRRCGSKCHPKASNCCNHDMMGGIALVVV